MRVVGQLDGAAGAVVVVMHHARFRTGSLRGLCRIETPDTTNWT